MKKDKAFCLRMSTAVREALQDLAKKERRSVASLIDKLIHDYLEAHDMLPEGDTRSDRRQFHRTRVTLPAKATVSVGTEVRDYPCVIQEISSGGALVVYPKGLDLQVVSDGKLPPFELSFVLPQSDDPVKFHCHPRHITENGVGLQVGAMFEDPAEESLTKLRAYLN